MEDRSHVCDLPLELRDVPCLAEVAVSILYLHTGDSLGHTPRNDLQSGPGQADFGPTFGRLWADFGPTFGRLWADFGSTLGRLGADFWPTLGRLWAVIILHLSGAIILHL